MSLLTNSMGVEGGDDDAIINAVVNAGYGCSLKTTDDSGSFVSDADALEDHETPLLRKRLLTSLAFLLVLMYFSMGHHMLGLPIPGFLDGYPVRMGLLEMLLATIVMMINRKFFINGWKSLIHGAPSMDTLIAMGSAAGYIYSVGVMIRGGGDYYFESSAMILTLITVGKMLEAKSKGRTTDALKGLMKLAPATAVVERDGIREEIAVSDIRVDDVFIVKPGESIAADGVVISGHSAVDESALTGESIPVDKTEGSTVSAATINRSGLLKCRAVRVGYDTTLSQIIKMVSDAAATKAPIAKIADKVSGIFVPAVISIAVLVTLIWLAVGRDFSFALGRGISVLVISCPCALGLATPVAIMVGNGMGAKKGILFKTAASLEECGKINIIALDKTGTITEGQPRVTDIIPAAGVDEKEFFTMAASLELGSEHPLAKALISKAAEENLEIFAVSDFRVFPGNGLYARMGSQDLYGGNLKFIKEHCRVPGGIEKKADLLASQGKTPMLFARGGRICGIIAVSDTIREDSARAIAQLKKLGIKTVMLTGDNPVTAKAIAAQAGVDMTVAGVLPDGKDRVIRKLKEKGRVAMVGDGINDAPALTSADIGIAIGAGTDVAIDAADVVLMKSNLTDACAAVRLSRRTLKTIHQNLFWAFFYNAICIPIAAGALVKAGLTLNPMIGAAAMSLSSFFVVMNALRLNLFDMYDESGDRPGKNIEIADISDIEDKFAMESRVDTMNKTITIEGMMCGHCEKAVREALECLPGVVSASPSFKTGLCSVELSEDVDNEILKAAVEDEDFKVIDIK